MAFPLFEKKKGNRRQVLDGLFTVKVINILSTIHPEKSFLQNNHSCKCLIFTDTDTQATFVLKFCSQLIFTKSS